MNKNLLFALGLVTTIAAAGCADDGRDSSSSGDYGSRGLALTTDFLSNTDVAGMRYEIWKCSGGQVYSADRHLEDVLLPGMIPTFENRPFDEDSEHNFADSFVMLSAGCYDVKITPLRANGQGSSDCASVMAEGVIVVDQLTTEILLVSQCKGAERGGLDTAGALNHPPIIETLSYNPSKFITCGEENGRPSVELCAMVRDPDFDPLGLVWKQIGGAPVYSGPTVTERSGENGWEQQCVRLELPYGSAGYEFELTVYDLFHGEGQVPVSTYQQNTLIRAERWFELNGYGSVDSHAKLRFPLYVSCEDPCDGCEVEQTCPHTYEYWKSHNKYAENQSQKIPWPMSEDTQMCGKSWLEILKTPDGGDMFYVLVYQYIAARLNLANNGPTSLELLAKVAEAEGLLSQCKEMTAHDAARKAALLLSDYLDKYNTNRLLKCNKGDDWCAHN